MRRILSSFTPFRSAIITLHHTASPTLCSRRARLGLEQRSASIGKRRLTFVLKKRAAGAIDTVANSVLALAMIIYVCVCACALERPTIHFADVEQPGLEICCSF